MSLPVLAPPFAPSTSGTTRRIGVRQRAIQFSDGYEQRGENGLNSRPRSATWTWKALTWDEAKSIETFLEGNAITGFRYALPDDSERTWRVDGEIEVGYPTSFRNSLTVQVREIFDPGTGIVAGYGPALDFSDARNSMYSGHVV